MRIFWNRPLALASCLCAVTAVMCRSVSGAWKLSLSAVVGLLFLALLLCSRVRKRVGRRTALTLLCAVGVTSALVSSYLFFDVRFAEAQSLNGQECVVEGVVTERSSSAAYNSLFRVSLEKVNGKDFHGDAMLECDYPSSLQVGDRFRITATPRAFTEDELFDEQTYRLSDGCLTVLTSDSAEQCEMLAHPSNDLTILASRWNTRLSYGLRETVGGEAGGVAAALLLGNRSWLSDLTVLNFQRAGVSHLLALSGLHVSIVIGALELLLHKLRLPKAVRAVLIPFAALGYLALTGFSVSTWRAVLMICVLYLAFLFGSSYDAFTSLSLTLALILTLTPYAVLDLSLWMSYLAAGSIIVFSPAFQSLLEAWRKRTHLPSPLFRALGGALTALLVGAVANLALLLLSASVFGEVSLLSVPATLLLSVPVTLLLICSALCLVFPFLGAVCGWIAECILAVVSFCSSIDGVMLPMNDIPTRVCLILLTLALIALAVLKLRRRGWGILVPVLCVATVCASLCVTHFGDTEYQTTVAAGFGEVRLYAKHGNAVVVNDTRGNASAAYEIKAALTDARCSEVDHLIMSRYYNQATYFISRLAGETRVERLHLPTPTTDKESAIAMRLEEEAAKYGIEVLYDAEAMLATYDRQ